MIKDEIIRKRAKIYDDIRKSSHIGRDHGIYFDIKITDDLLSKLIHSTKQYIIKSLTTVYKDHNFIFDDNFLIKYEKQILNLPNRTPNGAFYPKKENIVEYNRLQKNIVFTLQELGILDKCLAIQPCTVRAMCGKSSEIDHTRPLATTKLHSDSWASHVGDAILGVPLLGDSTTTIEFFEPQDTASDFFSPLQNYDDGQKKFKDKKFLGYAQMGHVSIFDHACLHRTVLKDGDMRISFDFGIIVNNENSLFYEADKRKKDLFWRGKSRYQYFDLDVYSKLGTELFISVEESMEAAGNRYKKEAGSYERADIKIVKEL